MKLAAPSAPSATSNQEPEATTSSTPEADQGYTVAGKTITVTGSDAVQSAIDYIESQDDKSGWTIDLSKDVTYKPFNVRKGLDHITFNGNGATVTVLKDDLTPYQDDFTQKLRGVVVQSTNVSLGNIIFDMGDQTSDYWASAAIAASNGKTTMEIANGLKIDDCTFNGKGIGFGIFLDNRLDTYSITNCVFNNLVDTISTDNDTHEAVTNKLQGCGIYDETNGGLKDVTVDGNTFNNCSFAWHGSWDNGDNVTPNSGTYKFTNNTVKGSKDVRSKVVIQDSQDKAATDVTVAGNKLTNAMIGTVNLTLTNNEDTKVNDPKADNTFNEGSYYTEACWYKNEQGDVVTYDVYNASHGNTSGYWTYDKGQMEAYAGQYGVSNETVGHIEQAIENANKAIAEGKEGNLVIGDNKNTAEVFTLNKNAITFRSYDPIKVTLKGTKTLKGSTLKAGQFTFELVDSAGKVVAKATNDADGNIVFDDLTFQKLGSYTYTIREVNAGEKGYTYDNYPEKVTINVTAHYVSSQSDANKLEAAVVTDDSDDSGIAFQNTYTDGSKPEEPSKPTEPAEEQPATPAAPKHVTAKTTVSAKASLPKTGDTQNGALAGILAALGLGAVAGSAAVRKPKHMRVQ